MSRVKPLLANWIRKNEFRMWNIKIMKTPRECVLSELDSLWNVSGNLKDRRMEEALRTRRQKERRCFIAACGGDQYLRRLVASGSFAYSNTHSKLPPHGCRSRS
ncbi:hypothetical protein TcasGA2_TC009728 [Tribolium castaneum]|uniref:Uncharacterized protein n=1 Tax=Tribolium castaneum TaxID=7070 RepID=D6WUA3_TRICA|nr:hypothetical protein TcasGA2_TC009728 [Tribolium castaneum]